MKILITGASGMLAQAVREKFAKDASNEIILTDITGKKVGGEEIASNGNTEVDSLFLDITDFENVKNVFNEVRPALVINCAAYTAVDKAETQEGLAYKINADGPGNLARACVELGKTEEWRRMAEDGEVPEGGPVLVHISTDYVFGGSKPASEEYSEDDEKKPETAYGRTKLAGEEQIEESGCNYYIFRTAWLYGHGGKNFVETMLSVARTSSLADARFTRRTGSTARSSAPAASNSIATESIVRVVADQHGSPTYTEDLTDIIYQAVTKHISYGIYNATDLGYTTWAGFTEKIYEFAKINCQVQGISSAEYEAQAKAKAGEDYKVAKRPLNSKMSKRKLLDAGVKIPTWEDGLKRYLKKEGV
ncbi:NAD(P)-dependent oxidoreductase [Candidatus Saccharibacteria bacterium]|nr:NAD(P)-dependent oxidoreductase [Candidatus Saccharibacteria bacterium]